MAVNSFNAQNPPVTTKGDVFTFSTIPTRLGVGANDTVLTADSSTATGLKWAAVSAGGMTLISTATPSAATTVSFTSIPTTYKALLLVWNGIYQSVASTWCGVRLNNDTTGKHWAMAVVSSNGNFAQTSQLDENLFGTTDKDAPIPATTTSSGNINRQANGQMWIFNADQTTGVKKVHWTSSGYDADFSGPISANGVYTGTSAISRIDFIRTSSQTITGTIRLYGVS